MAYKEAIERSTCMLVEHIKNRVSDGNITRGQYLADCLFVAAIISAQSEHLQASSAALLKQTTDLLASLRRY